MLPKTLFLKPYLIPEKGLTLNGTLSAEVFGIAEEDRLQCPYPLHYELTAVMVDHNLLVRGRLETRLRCICDRCLGVYEDEITLDNVCHLIEDIPEDGVDLTSEIREDIVVGFPLKQLCSENCAGLCPACGQNLNESPCACGETNACADVWSALDHFDSAADPNNEA